jgi:hypothetical protein
MTLSFDLTPDVTAQANRHEHSLDADPYILQLEVAPIGPSPREFCSLVFAGA